jgi:hypothetical protein
MTGAKVLNSKHGADINAEGRVLVYGRAKSTNRSQETANVLDEFTV